MTPAGEDGPALRRVPLSVLDLANVWSGTTSHEAVAASVELARRVERLGFARYWFAEHHNRRAIASSSPPVLIGAVAAATERLRVGSGGVMLPNHAPLVVAEQFGTLEALHPGRIDLGIGRAPGTDPLTAAALRRSTGPLTAEEFPRQLGELMAFFGASFPEDHPYRSVAAVPANPTGPSIWLLGSSGFSAQLAGILGLPFVYAHHFTGGGEHTAPALALYRERFHPSEALPEPHSMISVQVFCADDDERAQYLAAPSVLGFARRYEGRDDPLPTPEEAAAHTWSPRELAYRAERLRAQAVGSPGTVRRVLAELLERTGADELMVTTPAFPLAERVHSMELVRELFGPEPLPAPLA